MYYNTSELYCFKNTVLLLITIYFEHVYCCFSTTDVILLPPAVDSGVRVTRSLVLCECFVDCCLSFCPVLLRFMDSDYPFGIFKPFFIRVAWRMPLVEQELYTVPQHMSALPDFLWGSCFTIFILLFIVLKIIVCLFITYPLAIELLDLLRFAASDNPFGSFKHFFLWQTWYI